jgi:hypothetical protein
LDELQIVQYLSSGISGTGETPQIAKRPRRLTARPAESVRLFLHRYASFETWKGVETEINNINQSSVCPKEMKHCVYGTKIIYFIF